MQLWFRHKLMAGSFLILVFSTIYGVYCLQTVRNLAAVVQLTVENAMTASTFTEKAKFDFSRFDQEACDTLRSAASNLQRYHYELAIQFADSILADIKTVQEREMAEEDRLRLQLAISKVRILREKFEKLKATELGFPRDARVAEWNSQSQRGEIYTILNTISIQSSELGISYRNEARATASTARQTIFSLIVCTAGLIFGVVLLLLTTALPPLKSLTEACREISKGKLHRRAAIQTEDEFGLLSHAFNSMIDRIETKDRNLASLLGAIPEAIFFFDRTGALSKEASSSTHLWFKDFKATSDIATFFEHYFHENLEKTNKLLELIWSTKTKADPETIFELLPSTVDLQLEKGVMNLRFLYRAQRGYNQELERIIVMAQDITSEVSARRDRMAQENHVARILNLTTLGFGRCRTEFERQMEELTQLSKSEHAALASDQFKRLLHGFKGSLSVLGFVEVAAEMHRLETHIETSLIRDEFDRLWNRCKSLLQDQLDQLSKILKTSPDEDNIRLSKDKVDQLTLVASRIDDGELTTLLETFKSVDLGQTLAKYRTYVQNVIKNSIDRADTVRLLPSETLEYESDEKAIELHLNANRVQLPPLIANQIDLIVGHLVRNAVDHGIEPKWERKAIGKSEVGAITIHAKLTELPNHVVQLELGLTDDGRGIDTEKLKRLAVERGVWTDDQAESASLQQAMSLIFLPNFTTRTNVNEVSGRGVGLDAVKAMIERLGGGLGIQSKKGYGTRFKLHIPIKAAELRANGGPFKPHSSSIAS